MCYKNEYQKRAHGEVERIFREALEGKMCRRLLTFTMKQKLPGSQKSANYPYQTFDCLF